MAFLTKEDPLERLDEFCSNGYVYTFETTQLGSGWMCGLKIQTTNVATTLCSRFYYVTGSIEDAKKTLAAVVLQELGLGVAEGPEITPSEDPLDEFSKMGVSMLTNVMGKVNEYLSNTETPD